jgi:aminopeptidase N
LTKQFIMKKLILFGWVAAVLFAACGGPKEVTSSQSTANSGVQTTTSAEGTGSDEVKEIPVYRATPTRYFDLVHTKLDVRFDWNKSHMLGKAEITARPHFYTQTELVLDAKGMDIHSVTMGGKPLTYTYEDDVLTVQLGREVTRDEKITVVVDYTAKPDERETGGSSAISSDKGLYFINPRGEDKSKMPQIWTQGETEASSVWFPTIDRPNQKMTQEILMTVDDKYVTLSNGKLIKSTKNADGTLTDHWKQDLPHAPYLAMMGVGEFKVVKDQHTRKDGSKIDVHYFVEPEWEPYAKAIFGKTPEMIGFFSELLGVEYPWDKYHQIVVRDYVSGAMENTGAVIFGDFVYMNDRELLDANSESIIAHELFHHWFGDLVTCESWSNLPLNESFANYSQFLWDEYKYGLDEAEYQAEVEANGYFQTAQYQGMHNMIWFDYDDKEQMFDGHSYNKGGRILHMLRNHIGDEAFFASIKLYLTKHAYQPAEIHELRLAFEEVTGQDLNWFFNQWFFAQGHPILNITQKRTSAGVEVTIQQKQNFNDVPLYKLPMKISVFDGKKRTDYPVVVTKSLQTFEFPIQDSLSCVIVDADHVILAEWNDNKPVEQYIFQFYHGGKYADRRDGLANGAKSKTEAGRRMILDALNDPFYKIRELAIKQATRVKKTNKDELITHLTEMVKNDERSSVRAAALDFMLTNFDAENATKESLAYALKNDQSYRVLGSALQGMANYDAPAALAKAKELEKENAQSMLVNIASLYGKHGDASHFEFYKELFDNGKVGGFSVLGVVASFGAFVRRNDEEVHRQALVIFTDLSKASSGFMGFVLPNVLTGIVTGIDSRISALKSEIGEHEKANDPALADKKRKQLKAFEEVKTGYVNLQKSLTK